MAVRVRHHIDRLAEDYAGIPPKATVELRKIASDNVKYGRDLAKAHAREKSGPHGSNYYKRITSEMTGPLTGEYGPHDGGTPVGAGYRHGPPNMDLPVSADKLLPSTSRDVRMMLTRLFS